MNKECLKIKIKIMIRKRAQTLILVNIWETKHTQCFCFSHFVLRVYKLWYLCNIPLWAGSVDFIPNVFASSRMNARMCNLRSQPVATLPRSSDVSDTSVIGFWTEQMKLIGMRSLSLGLIGSLGAEPKTLVVIYLSLSSIHLTTDRRPKGTVSLALHHRHRASADFC